ncbi:PEP-CTERM sorting domain-containing protein [Myxococcota bacterium]|nr:PEP-CTERM sorting domain-containing protein [Myxococcota bacterium]
MSSITRIVTFTIVLFMAGLLSGGVASAVVIWDEATDGSLSTDRFTPTDMGTLGTGSNDVIGSTVSGISKFFSITLGAGTQLSALIVEDWDSLDDLGFLGVVTGTPFTVDPANPNVAELLGYAHYGELDVGQDILQTVGSGPGSQGFSGPLGEGTYSFWVRQGGPDAADWDLNFVVTPEPGAGLLLGAGLIGFAMRRRRG